MVTRELVLDGIYMRQPVPDPPPTYWEVARLDGLTPFEVCPPDAPLPIKRDLYRLVDVLEHAALYRKCR